MAATKTKKLNKKISDATEQAKAANAPPASQRIPYVQVATVEQVERAYGVPIRGRTEAARSGEMSSRI